MKQLEITTNKRLLIVEFEDMDHLQNVLSCDKKGIRFCTDNDEPTKLICKGSDITEDIAKGLVNLHENGYYKDYLNDNNFFTLPSKSFISAIQSKNYHWGDNPVKKPIYSTIIYGCLPGAYRSYVVDLKEWRESESRTFNPSKCIIFEIL